jgi:SNF2 family DNA or RNA helicase
MHTLREPRLAIAPPECLELVWPATFEIHCVALPLEPGRLTVVGCLFPEGRARLATGSKLEPSAATLGERDRPQHIPEVPRPASATCSLGRLHNHLPVSAVPGERQRHTRIRPPRDVVKLEDRLRFLLEPPLESLLGEEGLEFTHRPFPYQLDGIAFLYSRHHAVLADEMGLGKTMQAVTSVRLLIHRDWLRRILLICPKPLVSNWQREFRLWAPELPVTVVEGTQLRRHWLWQQPAALITITNYETLVRDRDVVHSAAGHFDLVILDEAQRIKNRSGATSEAVCGIPRSRSWALTGTPIENSADDLVGIFDFVRPGQIEPGMKLRSLRDSVADVVLRRTKDRVLADMPPKLFRDADVVLTPEQQATYQLAEDEGVLQLSQLEELLTVQHVFELIIRLKQICNFDPSTGASAKLERLEADLEECAASGRKALVFSQWVDTLTELELRLAGFHPLCYHGRVPHARRQAVIDEFRDDPRRQVLLMSYGAGGVGLNLQFASYVFLFDRWWNPAVEDQAVNRAHRIGAAGPVTVTRFLTLGTIEERINQVLADKRALFDSVFGDDLSTHSQGLSRDEVFALFNLKTPHESVHRAA